MYIPMTITQASTANFSLRSVTVRHYSNFLKQQFLVSVTRPSVLRPRQDLDLPNMTSRSFPAYIRIITSTASTARHFIRGPRRYTSEPGMQFTTLSNFVMLTRKVL